MKKGIMIALAFADGGMTSISLADEALKKRKSQQRVAGNCSRSMIRTMTANSMNPSGPLRRESAGRNRKENKDPELKKEDKK